MQKELEYHEGVYGLSSLRKVAGHSVADSKISNVLTQIYCSDACCTDANTEVENQGVVYRSSS